MSRTKPRSSAAKNIAIFFIVFMLLEALIIFGLNHIFKNEDSSPSFGGYSFFVMDSDNMGSAVPKHTLVIAVNGTPAPDKIGSAVLCKNVGDEGTTVARLNMIDSKGDTVDGVVYTVYQENVQSMFYELDGADIIGVATSHYVTAGKIISFLTTPFGMGVSLGIPFGLLVILELIITISKGDDDDDDYDDYEDEEDEEEEKPRKKKPQPKKYYKTDDDDEDDYIPQDDEEVYDGGDSDNSENITLDDFLYGGSDDVYGAEKPSASYREEFIDARENKKAQQLEFADRSPKDVPPTLTPEIEDFLKDDDEDDEVTEAVIEDTPEEPQEDPNTTKLFTPVQSEPTQQFETLKEDAAEIAPAPKLDLEKPVASQPAAEPADTQEPVQAEPAPQPHRDRPPVQRRRPAQSGTAQRRRPAPSGTRGGSSAQRRTRPAGQSASRPPRKDANAAIDELLKMMQEEQQKLNGDNNNKN